MSATKPAPRDRKDPFDSLPRLDRFRPKGPPVRPSRVSRRRALVLVLVHVAIGLHIWHWLATGESVTPLEPSEAKETLEQGLVNAGFLLFCAAILSTLVFGRWFCGWTCHIVAVQDLSAWLLGRAGLRPKPVRSRLLVFAPWVVAGHMFLWPHVRHWFEQPALPDTGPWQLHLTTSELWRTFPGPIMAIATFVVVGFLIVWWLGAKGFCTYGCPYGAFFAMADRLAPVRIVVDPARCESCGHCTSACSSNVRVHEEVAKHGKVVDPGCMKCLDCVSVCPKDALSVGVAKPRPFVSSQQRIGARGDFTWPEELLLAVVAVVATQFVFRGAWFGEYVPFLLAVGLGVITAVATLLALRFVRRPEFAFQHWTWKAGGRATRGGRLAILGLAAWLLFTAHTGGARWLKSSLVAEMSAMPRDATPAMLEQTLANARFVHAFDLVDDPVAGELEGLLLRRLGRDGDAEAVLRRSHATRDGLEYVEASLALADYAMRPERREFALADKLVASVLQRMPDHPTAVRMRAFLDSVPR